MGNKYKNISTIFLTQVYLCCGNNFVNSYMRIYVCKYVHICLAIFYYNILSINEVSRFIGW